MRKIICTLFFLRSFSICTIAQVYDLPVFDRSDTPALHVDKVEITKDATYIYCTYSAIAGSWANISQETHLLDETTKKKYFLVKCDGIPFGPEQRTFTNAEKCDIRFTFPPTKPKGRISLIESNEKTAFNIWGIDITKRFEKVYTETDIDRFYNMASFYDSSGDSLKATNFIKEAICAAEYVCGVKSETKQLLLANASIMYGKYGYYERAIELAKQEEALYRELGNVLDENYALRLRIIAQYYSNTGNHDKAIELYKKSINLYESLNIKDKQYAYALRFLSDEYYRIGDNENSFLYGEKSILARKLLGDNTDYIDELSAFVIPENNKSIVIRRLDFVKKELENLPKFVDLSSLGIARLYKQIANTYNIIDYYDDAIIHCNKSLTIFKKLGYDYIEEYVSVLSLKCKVLNYMNKLKEALASGTEAKHLMDSLSIHTPKYAELLSDLAAIYAKDYDFEKAIQLQNQACGVYEVTSEWIDIAASYKSLGDYYKDAMDYDNAELCVRKALDIFGKHNDVKQYYEEEVKRTGNNFISFKPIEGYYYYTKNNIIILLAQIQSARKNYVDAIETEKISGSVLKELGDQKMYAMHLNILAQYYFQNNQDKEAIECLEQIPNYSDDNCSVIVLAQMLKACIYYKRGNLDKAIQYTLETEPYINSSNDYNSKIIVLSAIATFLLEKHNIAKAEDYASKALDLVIEEIKYYFGTMTSEQKQRLWDQYRHMFILYRKIIVESDRNNLYLSKLYNYVLFSKSLLLDVDRQGVTNMLTSWTDIQKVLSDQDIVIDFIATKEDDNHNAYHALLIDKNNPQPVLLSLIKESELKEIREKDERDVRIILGELIWGPIISKYSHIKNIFFCPDGILHILPIEYYIVNEKDVMLEKYNLYRLSSTKEILSNHQSPNTTKAVLYGGLDYNQKTDSEENSHRGNNKLYRSISERGGFEPLANTLDEIREIDNILNKRYSTTLLSGKEGTEESFKAVGNRNVSIIHLATHGMYVEPEELEEKKQTNNFEFIELLFNNNPVREDAALTHSFLVMSGGNSLVQRYSSLSNEDGILTAKEISELDLKNVDLVVLSACETALGDLDGNGIYGLQRGFKKAGVNTILMSLNKVDDEATKILMIEFYRNLMNGETKQQSLRNAQRYLRQVDNGKYNKPEYWASFILLDGLNKTSKNDLGR